MKESLCAMCNLSSESYRIIYEDKFSYCIVIKHPLKRGHLMVLPKRHVIKLDLLTGDELKSIFFIISVLESILPELYGNDIIINLNRKSHSSIPHLHFHIIPVVANIRTLLSNYDKTIKWYSEESVNVTSNVRDEIKPLFDNYLINYKKLNGEYLK